MLTQIVRGKPACGLLTVAAIWQSRRRCLTTILNDNCIDDYLLSRPESVNSPDSLLQFHRIPRHIDVNQSSSNLQIYAFSASARRNQKPRSIRRTETPDFR